MNGCLLKSLMSVKMQDIITNNLQVSCFMYIKREKYRRYKDLYKKFLEYPENENIINQMRDIEDELDIANILMAREQAKLEVN